MSLLDALIAPALHGDAAARQQARAVVRSLLAISATLAGLLVGFLLLRSAPAAVEVAMFAVALVIPLAGIALMRATGRIVAGLMLSTLAGIALIGAWAWVTGGINSVVLPWALALLALLSIFGNLPLLGGAAALLAVMLVLLYVATVRDWTPASILPGELVDEMLLLSLLSSALLTVIAAALVLREREQSRVRLRAAHRDALAASRAKSAFLASVSHEFRTPLAAMIGYAEVLKLDRDEPLSHTQGGHVERILVAGDHLLALINQTIEMGRIEAGELELRIEAVRVGEAVAAALAMVELPAGRRGIVIDNRLRHTPAVFVCADATRLKQVLMNLISNALKFNRDDGSVTIATAGGSPGFTRISVTDTGLGIAADLLPGIFDTYAREGGASSRQGARGLGLSIAHRLVAAMGGSTGVESTLGEGSTFWIELPGAD
ncbi:MAG: sensor histidine kinase [Burkholderiales bacterium]